MNQLHVHIYPLPQELPSHSPHLTSRSSQRTRMSSRRETAVSPQLSISHMVMYIRPRDSLSPSHSLLPHPCPHVYSLCLCLNSCPIHQLSFNLKKQQQKKRLKLQGRNRGVCCFLSFIFFLFLLNHS